jgi:hypothetical protein
MQVGFSSKVALMRYRIKGARSKGDQERQREHRRTLALITTIACVPFLAVILIAVLSTEPDLSDLLPSNKQAGEYIVLSWSELLQPRSQLNSAVMKLDGSAVRALGYMMEDDKVIRPGDLVQRFFLLPYAGNLLDPAERFGDQMVSVRLREGDRLPFSPRQLIWVWGTFRISRGDPSGPTPLYSLENARAQAADRADIALYFQ